MLGDNFFRFVLYLQGVVGYAFSNVVLALNTFWKGTNNVYHD